MTDKPFKTYEEQLDLLKNQKGLHISDDETAIAVLKKESYFALINGYKEPFKKVGDNSHFSDNATFNDIYTLYKYDEAIRLIYLKFILVIERNMKSLISYAFCRCFGDREYEYFNAANYKYIPSNIEAINRFVGTLSNSYRKSKDYQYIEHYCRKYKNVPLWVLMNALTFGQVSKMFQYMPDSIQVEVAKSFECLRQNELEKMLSFITLFRNVCAHNERLYNYKTRSLIPKKYVHEYMGCGKNGHQDLFAVVICFKYLLDETDFRAFISEQQSALAKYKPESQTLPLHTLLSRMGFPDNWRKILEASKSKPLTHLDFYGNKNL